MPNSDGTLEHGERLGAYTVHRLLGSGGMADVYFAVHQELDRPSALKVLRKSLATDETQIQRFMQEARAAAALIHPNIVQVYDVGRESDLRYIAQEYVAGSNLREYLSTTGKGAADPAETQELSYAGAPPVATEAEVQQPTLELSPGDPRAATREVDGARNPDANTIAVTSEHSHDRQLKIEEVLSITLQVLAALAKSASSGIVHRDIKPENIMLTTDGQAKVADFGLARIMLGDDPNLTRAGTTLGTPMYMSPEQIQDGKVDIRSDLYSLGVTIFHMLAGRPPFLGESPLAIAMQHVQASVPELTGLRDGLPASLNKLVSRLLEKSPDDRFEGPQKVLDFLREHRANDLAAYWPDQAVPLPGAVSSSARGPMQETLALAAALRKERRGRAKSVVGYGLAAGALALAFILGYWPASRVNLLADAGVPTTNQVPQLENARKQYEAALLNSKSGVEDWEAVKHYFGKQQDRSSKRFVAMAELQVARLFNLEGDNSKARRKVEAVFRSEEDDQLVRGLAKLMEAKVSDEQEEPLKAATEEYRQLKNQEDKQAMLDYAAALLVTWDPT